jgi:predicted HicB family RNase H-like nuclease
MKIILKNILKGLSKHCHQSCKDIQIILWQKNNIEKISTLITFCQDMLMLVVALPSYNSSRSTRSSQNISFRLRKDQLDQLREEARQKRISLNTLVSQIVDSYVNFISNFSNAHVIPYQRQYWSH